MKFITSRIPQSRASLVLFTVFAQVVLVALTYKRLILHPHEYLLCKHYDGIKTYFAFQYYINQPWQKDPLMFMGMNYPFGDNILFTDNGTLIAWLIKAVSTVVPALARHAVPVYNLLLIGFIVLSTLVLVRILSMLLKNRLLIVAFSLILPWTNPQLHRFTIGHLNLSMSVVLLIGIYCLLRLYFAYYNRERSARWVALFVVSLVLFSLVHMYYLVLVLAFAGFFYFFWFLWAWHKKEPLLPIVRNGLLITSLPLAVCLGILRLVDSYQALRSAKAMGYDTLNWKLNFSALYTGYSYNEVRFPFETTEPLPYESYMYLGGFALFGLVLWLVLHFFVSRQTYSFAPLGASLSGNFLILLGLASLMSFFISLGDYYYVLDNKYRFINYLNIFFYLQLVTDMVTQFRCLARFAWIFFWTFHLVLLFLIDRSLNRNSALWYKAAVGVLVLFAVIDLKNTLRFSRHESIVPNILYASEHITEVKNLAAGINPQQYQAILTIPYYHVGSEGDYSFTIDPEEEVSNFSMQLSLQTGLPLMASKLARTPPDFAHQQLILFTSGAPAPEVRQRMDSRPVLVIYNKAYYDGRNPYYDSLTREPAATAVREAGNLPQRLGMQKLDELNDWVLYRWQPLPAPAL